MKTGIIFVLVTSTSYILAMNLTIHDAASQGNIEALTRLLEESPDLLNKKNAASQTPLLCAVKHNQAGAVRLLIKKDASRTGMGDNDPFFHAIRHQKSTKIVQIFLDAGSNPNGILDYYGGDLEVPLEWAALAVLDNIIAYAKTPSVEKKLKTDLLYYELNLLCYPQDGKLPRVLTDDDFKRNVIKEIVKAAEDAEIQQKGPRNSELDTVRLLLSRGASLSE